MAEIQSWFKKNASVVCRIIGPVGLMARVASRGMEEEIHFLDIMIPMTSVVIDQWDGQGVPPKPLSTKTKFVKAMEEWHRELKKKTRHSMENLMEEDSTELPLECTPLTNQTHICVGKKCHQALWHCMPRGTTKKEVHDAFVLNFCGSKSINAL